MRFTRRLLWISLGALLLALAIAAFAIWWIVFRGSDPPPSVNTEAQVEFLEEQLDGALPENFEEGAGISGEWEVDTEIGSLEEGTSSFGGYRVREEILGIGATTAVGRTRDISGSIEILDSDNGGFLLEGVMINVDLRTLESERPSRDGAARDALETDKFPFVEFSLTSPFFIPATALEEGLKIEVKGNLTIHGETAEVSIPIDAQLVRGVIIVVAGEIDIKFSDFGISRPTSAQVLSISDTATIEFLSNFRRAP